MRRQPAPLAASEPIEAPAARRPAAPTVPTASFEEIAALRADVAAMSRSVATLAPRNAIVALEGALRDLSDRVSAMADPAARASLIAPFGAAIAELRDAVRAQNVQGVAEALDRDIRALAKKVDTLSANAVDREAFEGIRRQTEETKSLLANMLAKTAPLERIENQVGTLADRVESLAANPQPAIEARASARRARRACAPASSAARPRKHSPRSRRRIEKLAERVDSALSQPRLAPAVDMRIVDGLTERLESMRQSIAARPPAVDGENLESALRDLSDKLDQRTARSLDIKPLEAALSHLEPAADPHRFQPVGRRHSRPHGQARQPAARRLQRAGVDHAGNQQAVGRHRNQADAAAPFNVVQRPGPDEVASSPPRFAPSAPNSTSGRKATLAPSKRRWAK